MARLLLTEEGEFEVGENKGLNYTIAILFFLISVVGVIDGFTNSLDGVPYFYVILVLLLLPGIHYFRKARITSIYIRVNKKGIYQNEILITNWNNFLKAKITQKSVFFSMKDNFVLVLEYFKENSDKGFRRTIPLGNTQNKSEEEVLEAIKYFWRRHHGMEEPYKP